MTSTPLRLRLYLAGHLPHSEKAHRIVVAALEEVAVPCELEVVDVLESPARALEDGVLVTPTLVKITPEPLQVPAPILQDPMAVRRALGLGRAA